MDGYLQILYNQIIDDIITKIGMYLPSGIIPGSAYLHTLAQEIKEFDGITFNYNEEGRLHSKYLGDRYEPAIIIQCFQFILYYYLFDGEIKDCVHPFSIIIYDARKQIEYYSSERIKQKLPIGIFISNTIAFETYNMGDLKPLLEGYKSERVEIKITDYPEQDYTLHDCMEPALSFKFAD